MFFRSALFALALGAVLPEDASALSATPLRGEIAVVDNPIESNQYMIYGPFEAGFTSTTIQQLFNCTTDKDIMGGLDTLIAEHIAEDECNMDVSVLDYCGGHGGEDDFHFHERLTCHYTNSTSGHSTRIGTASDGHALYGKYVDGGVLPTDLDACSGRWGTPPGSNGTAEYYYMTRDVAPFTLGCFGPNDDDSPVTMEQCRALYPDTCGDGDAVTITVSANGNVPVNYDPDCPCFGDVTTTINGTTTTAWQNVAADDLSWQTNAAGGTTSGSATGGGPGDGPPPDGNGPPGDFENTSSDSDSEASESSGAFGVRVNAVATVAASVAMVTLSMMLL